LTSTDPVPSAPRTRRPVRSLLGAAVATAVLAAGGAVWISSTDAPPAPEPVAVEQAVARPTAAVVGVRPDGGVPWDRPLRLAVTDGTVAAVRAVDPDGLGVPGSVGPDGIWLAGRTLLPAATYEVTVTVKDAAGAAHDLPLKVQTTPATSLLQATLSPGDDAVVGVGQPVVLALNRPVAEKAARAALEARLTVRTTPAVEGSWRWMDDTTLHYRPAEFWKPGTTVAVTADLTRLALPGGTWGSGGRTTRFTVDDALVSTVDVAKKTMTVRKDGKVLRVLKASMGRPEFPTRNGTFLVLEKNRRRVMDSATVNLPPGSPAYLTAVEHAVRISYSGTFTHGAPWSVKDQGVRNVSHGCINLSPADAAWYYDLARRGDVITVVNSSRDPLPYDPGSMDWNMSFAEWRTGSALD
jgi:lipoprotein-anchoring transpeptidase ErfK/SrfK